MTFLKTNTPDDQYIVVDNMLVDKKMHDIARRINDYDEHLAVLCVEPDKCAFSEAPFVLAEIVDTKDGPQVYKVFEFWELNDSVLERIYASDTRKVDVLAEMDKKNQKIKDETNRRYREKMLATADIAASIVDSKKSSYTYRDDETNEKVTLYDDRPAERKP